MALALDHEIGTNTGTAVTSLAVTASGAVAQGDLICFVVAGAVVASLSSVTDSKGNTYTVVENVSNTGNGSIGIAFANAATALATNDTITGNFSTSETVVIEACCFSGFTNQNPTLDQTSAESHGTSTAPVCAAVTTTVAAEVQIAGVCVIGTSTTFSAGAAYTKTAASPIWNGTAVGLGVEYRILSATGSYTATATLGLTRAWEAGAATIYDGAAAAVARERGLLGVGS